MAAVNGVVEGVSTKFGKYSILVNGTWYSTKIEWATVQPEKGAQVSFDDGGAKFLKNVKVLSGGSSSGASAGPAPSKGFNSLGVELGHAANLAMQVMLARSSEPGTAEFYADFVDQTQAIFKVMKTLRTHYENGESTSLELESKVEAAEKRAAPKKRTAEEDLF